MEKERRIYIVSTTNRDGEPYALDLAEISMMSNEDFIEEAEGQGWVWSSIQSFAETWNKDLFFPNPAESVMRII